MGPYFQPPARVIWYINLSLRCQPSSFTLLQCNIVPGILELSPPTLLRRLDSRPRCISCGLFFLARGMLTAWRTAYGALPPSDARSELAAQRQRKGAAGAEITCEVWPDSGTGTSAFRVPRRCRIELRKRLEQLGLVFRATPGAAVGHGKFRDQLAPVQMLRQRQAYRAVPCSVNLMALLARLMMIWVSARQSESMTIGVAGRSAASDRPFCVASGRSLSMVWDTRPWHCTRSSVSVTLPSSIFATSRMSLISDSRWRALADRGQFTCPGPV